MSGYENVVGGKLRLKGKALTIKEGLVKKNKKKKHKHHYDQEIQSGFTFSGGISSDPNENKLEDEEHQQMHDDYLTPAERRYMEHWQKLELHQLSKTANKSHRDRIQEFNQYLANLSEHYDIPKVGPG
ncbi:Protein FAM32A protein [Dioscorea alata]|nr:Protein FAM32A protein [Dioscorea alata]KAH7688942.1 Protein FAM32A protein [Dioscorea alata]KAH7688943.1 Protein FAM32A protein [Dioscorea alata]KAH7688945.1 Protein FAM32A protein [Dioscorea alata]